MALPLEVYDAPIRVEWKLLASLRADEPTITNVELARRLGVNPNTMTRWLNDPLYQRFENWILTKNFEALPLATQAELRDTAEYIADNAQEMSERLYGIIQRTGDAKLEADLCKDWLDRAGFAPQRKVNNDGRRPLIITAEAMEILVRRAREAGLDAEPVADAVLVEAATGS